MRTIIMVRIFKVLFCFQLIFYVLKPKYDAMFDGINTGFAAGVVS